MGVFQVNGEAVARGGVQAHAGLSTSVEGNAYLELDDHREAYECSMSSQDTVFKLSLKNIGTKEAHAVKVKAQLSDTLKAIETAGTTQNANIDGDNTVIFPDIDRLPAGGSMDLYIKVQAVKGGLATCRAFLTHEDIQPDEIEDIANVNVIGGPARR